MHVRRDFLLSYKWREREFRTNFNPSGDFAYRRNALRKIVIKEFLREEPGKGSKEKASYYKYFVEELRDGRRVYLTRPAWLRVGFDFVIHLEGEKFSSGKDNPSHSDILEDLIKKKREKPNMYRRLHKMMLRVYNCEEPDDILQECGDLNFHVGLSVEAILKIIKWFFIEQDIRYWNYSGRMKFKQEVIDKVSKVL